MTLEQAIARSVSHNEIARCEATQADLDALCATAEGSCELPQYGHTDVWGTTDAGDEWRLHVTVTAQGQRDCPYGLSTCIPGRPCSACTDS